MPLSRDQADKILQRNLANVLGKLNAGKTLTASERALIETEAGVSQVDTSSAFAKNWNELAGRLNISRKGLFKVRQRLADVLPEARADGRHDVAAWKRFFGVHHINASAIDAEPPGDDDELITTSEAEWRKRLLREKVEAARLANEMARREAIPLGEIQETLPAFLMTIRTDMNQIVADLAADLEGIDDYNEREEIIQKRVNQLLAILERCEYLDDQASSDTPASIDAGDVNISRIKTLEKSKRESKPPTKEKARLKREAKAQKPVVPKTKRP